MTHSEYSDEDIREMSTKEYRKKLPSGWMEVSRYESLALMIDALLSTPTNREFTGTELQEAAGISDRTFDNRIGSLVRLGIVNELEEGREEPRYTLNEKNPITQKIIELNRTVENVKSDDLPKTLADDWGDSKRGQHNIMESAYGRTTTPHNPSVVNKVTQTN